MKQLKKMFSLLVVTCLVISCLICSTACFGGGKTEFQKMFDDLGTNFCFAGGEGEDEIELNVDEDGLELIVGGGVGWEVLDEASGTYTNTMYIKKTETGYARYKRIARVGYYGVQQTNEYTPAEAVSEAQYKDIIKNALIVFLSPLADYEDKFVLDSDKSTENAKIYEADTFTTAKFKVGGVEYTNTYSDVNLYVLNGKLQHVSYTLTCVSPTDSSTGEYYYDRDSGSFDFPSALA